MKRLFKRRKNKEQHKGNTNVPESLSNQNDARGSTGNSGKDDTDLPNSLETKQAIAIWLLEGLDLAMGVSEATPAPTPLESAYALASRAVEIAQDLHNDDMAWDDMVFDIHLHVESMQDAVEDLKKRTHSAPWDKLVEALRQHLK